MKRLPVNTLKVDREFVDGIDKHDDSYSIAAAIINMARSLGLSVTAEGVETEHQLAVLRQLKCDRIQGYYLYKPVSVDEFKSLYLKQISRQQNES